MIKQRCMYKYRYDIDESSCLLSSKEPRISMLRSALVRAGAKASGDNSG